MSPKLSVVVPFYNVEAFFAECLESLAGQTLRDLEIIMVDDGSQDGSAVIAKAYAERDGRFTLVQQANQGLGPARNTGLRHATGEYLTFVDSDDVIPVKAFALMVGSLDRTGSDFATGNVLRFNEIRRWQSGMYGRLFERNREKTHITREHELIRDRIVCNKVFRGTFWAEHGFEFPGDLYEDSPVVFPAHVAARSVDVIKDHVYEWRVRPGSITNSRFELGNLRARLAMVDFVRSHAKDKAPGLVPAWDAYVLENDFEALVGAIAETAGEDERLGILELAAAELERIEPTAISAQKVRRRLMVELIRRRKIAELLEIYALDPAELRAIPAVRRGRLRKRWYARFPYFEDPVAGVPAAVYDVTDEIGLTARVSAARWENGLLHLEGSARLSYLEAAGPGSYTTSIWLRGSAGGARLRLAVTTFRLPEVTARSDQRGLCFDWTGWRVTIDPARLGRRPGNWQLYAEVACDGFSRADRVLNPWLGRDLWPAAHQRSADLLVIPIAGVDGRFIIKVQRAEAMVTGTKVADGALELTGWTTGSPTTLSAAVSDGTHALTAPLETTAVHGGRRTFRGRLPLSELARGLQRAADLADWDVTLTGPGSPVPLYPAAGLPEVRYGRDEHDIAITRTRYAGFRIVERMARPVVQAVRWLGDDLLTLTGDLAGAVERPEHLVLRHRVSGEEHLVPFEWRGGEFSVQIPVRGLDRFGELLPLGAGIWDLMARMPSGDLSVVVERGRIAELPGAHTAGLHEYLPSTQRMDSVELRVQVALTDSERGPYAQRILQETEYPRMREQPVRDLVLMDSFDSRQCSDSPRALAQELIRRGTGHEIVWVTADGQFTVPDGCRVVLRDSLEHYEAVATASHVVANNPMPGWYVKRPGQVYLQTWHGTPLKKIGFDIPAPAWAGADDYLTRFARDVAQWDHLISPNPFSTPIFARAFTYDGDQLEVGYPRNDLLRGPRAAETAAQVGRRLGLPPGKKVVLYAPTWRDDVAKTGAGMRINIDLDEFERVLGGDHVLLVRGHINVRGGIEGGASGRLVDVSRYPDIAELYVLADVLITDYSSVMFDYAVTGKPILFFTYDLEHYRDVLRGFYFDLPSEAPGPLLRTSAEVIAALGSLAEVRRDHAAAYAAFTRRFCPWDDGGASGRVIDRLFT